MTGTDTRSFDHAIKDETSRRRSWPSATTSPAACGKYYSEATRDGIRNFALSYGDDNPLFVDFDYGKHTRCGAKSSPQMISSCLSNPTFGDPLPEEVCTQMRGHVVTGEVTDKRIDDGRCYVDRLPGHEPARDGHSTGLRNRVAAEPRVRFGGPPRVAGRAAGEGPAHHGQGHLADAVNGRHRDRLQSLGFDGANDATALKERMRAGTGADGDALSVAEVRESRDKRMQDLRAAMKAQPKRSPRRLPWGLRR
jgi:hypothetical protein